MSAQTEVEPLMSIDELEVFCVSYQLYREHKDPDLTLTPAEYTQMHGGDCLSTIHDKLLLALNFDDALTAIKGWLGVKWPTGDVVSQIEIHKVEALGELVDFSQTAYARLKATDWHDP
jgi:hypothetical protein